MFFSSFNLQKISHSKNQNAQNLHCVTDIFIDDIHPEGLAAQDGRLRLGDQIIQINGVDVKTKTQAQEIFVTSSGDISFLVARPPCHDQYTCHLDEDSCDLDFQVSLFFFTFL